MHFFIIFVLSLIAHCANGANPNVILILTDDQGYGDLSCHGHPVLKTPHIDELAKQSTSLDNFHVSPFCSPTRAALLTGRMSDKTHVRSTVYARNFLNIKETTIAEYFKASAYHTAHFGKWHIGHNYPYRPMDRGFDLSIAHGDGGIGTSSDYWNNTKLNDFYKRNEKWVKFSGYCTDIFFDEAIKFIRGKKDKPFFVYLATNAPHAPWHVKQTWTKPYRSKTSAENSDFYAAISRIDHHVGKLRKTLKELKLDKNTIIIYLTDNGSSGNKPNGYNAQMRGKKGSVYEGGHRVPCFIHWPDSGQSLTKLPHLTHHFDLLPTLIDICKLKTPEKNLLPLDGISLRPILLNPEKKLHDRTFFLHQQNTKKHYTKWRNSLVGTDRWRMVNGKELYDIIQDPSQKKNIAKQHPDVMKDLRRRYDRYWEQLSPNAHPLARPIVGTRHQKVIKLFPDGWVRDMDKGTTWDQPHIRSANISWGYWPIKIAKKGMYRVTLRRWPKESNLGINNSAPQFTNPQLSVRERAVSFKSGKQIHAKSVTLVINDQSYTQAVPLDAKQVEFKIRLNQGDADLRAYFKTLKHEKFPVYFVELEPE